MNNRNQWLVVLAFLLGAFSETKIYFFGTLAIAEIFVFAIAPMLFLRNIGVLKRDGFMLFLYMMACVFCCMLVSSWYNHTPMPFLVKQMAVLYSVFSYFVFFHWMLRNNYRLIGPYFIGFALSLIIIIFVFNPAASLDASGSGYLGEKETQDIIQGPLFWVARVQAFANIPFYSWYLKTPVIYSGVAPIAYTVFVMLTTVSGRSASISFLIAGALMVLGRKSRISMKRVSNHLVLICFLGLTVIYGYKVFYRIAAENNWLGEEAKVKYMSQTRRGDSFLKLLMSGRGEFFVGLLAAIDQPIMGYGPHAIDTKGYWEKFLINYGDIEDLHYYYALKAAAQGREEPIPSHSCIIGAWHRYGIFGLVFYLWILHLIYVHWRRYSSAIPQWYGYFAISTGTYLWAIFFSGFSGRHLFALFMVCLFFARAVGKGLLCLPWDMEMEANRYD